MTITCAQCGRKRIVPECRSHLTHCSRDCYEESLLLNEDQIKRMARMGINRAEAAKVLEISYPHFYRKLKRQGLNGLFPTLTRKLTRAVDRAANS